MKNSDTFPGNFRVKIWKMDVSICKSIVSYNKVSSKNYFWLLKIPCLFQVFPDTNVFWTGFPDFGQPWIRLTFKFLHKFWMWLFWILFRGNGNNNNLNIGKSPLTSSASVSSVYGRWLFGRGSNPFSWHSLSKSSSSTRVDMRTVVLLNVKVLNLKIFCFSSLTKKCLK